MEKILLEIARESIKNYFLNNKPDFSSFFKEYPELKDNGASFVTLTKNGNLRGCIGSITAYRSLLDDVISNAQSSAFRDPRFPPLSFEELDKIIIEVSILTKAKSLRYKDYEDLKTKIKPGVDGVILKEGYQQATFLPQVWDELSSFDSFFSHLCLKAGMESNCLNLHPEISVYQVIKVKEDEIL